MTGSPIYDCDGEIVEGCHSPFPVTHSKGEKGFTDKFLISQVITTRNALGRGS